jgi:molecular chaperone HscC
VYQGESPRTANNVYLGELSLSLPPKAASELPVDVRFTYDVNGLLEVEAHVVPTDERHRVVIERTPGVLSPEDIARRFAELSALKVHPRDVQANLALMGRAERLFEENLGDVRRLIGEWLTLFQTELDSQDAARIERARRALSMRLDEVDRSPLPGA